MINLIYASSVKQNKLRMATNQVAALLSKFFVSINSA